MASTTRERILETSLALFNDHGEPAISTNHIAGAMDISPGNLYYHFRNKDEIVLLLYQRFHAAMDRVLVVPERRPPDMEDMWLYVHLVYETIWQYRFLYRDLNNLLIASLADHPKGRRILELAREVGADIDDGRVEIHFVINLEDLPREELDERERETVEKLSRLLPLVADRDLRVAVSGVPAVREGRISVERDLRVKVGFLTLPVVDLGDALGISSERLRRRLEFGLEPLVVESVAVLDDALLLKIGTRAAA